MTAEIQHTAQTRLLELYFDHNLMSLALMDRDFNFIRVNEAYARADLRRVEDFPGHNHFDFYPSDAKPVFEEVVRSKQPFQSPARPFEYAANPERGTSYWDVMLAPILDEAGEVQHLLLSLNDVTERVRAQQALQESEANLRLFFDTIDDFLFVLDGQGYIQRVNQTVIQRLGYSEAELIGQNILLVHPEECHQEALKIIGEMLTKQRDICPLPLQTASGERIPVETRVVTGMWNGQPALFGVSRDVAARQRSESERGDALALLQTVIDAVPVRIFWKDRDSRYLGCNPLFARDAGKNSPNELLGRDDYSMGWAEQAALYRADDQHVMASGAIKLNYEEPQTTPDGGTIWLRTSKVPLRNIRQEVIGVLGIYDDITAQKQVEANLRQAKAETECLLAEASEREFFLHQSQQVGQIGGWRADPVNNRVMWTEGVYDIVEMPLDYQPDFESGLEFYVPECRIKVVENLQHALETGESFSIQVQVKGQRSGRDKWVELRGQPHRDADGQVDYLMGTIQDICAQKEQEAKFQAVFENASDGIFLMDETGFVDCNPVGSVMYGVSRTALLGRHPVSFSPERQPNGRSSLEMTQELVGRAMSGEVQRFEWQNSPEIQNAPEVEITLSRLDMGSKPYLLALVRNISERKQTMRNLAQWAEEQATLLAVGRELAATLELDDLLQRIVDGGLKLTNMDTAAVYLCDGEMLHLQTANPQIPPDFPDVLRHAPLEKHHLIRRVIQSGQALFIEDLQAEALEEDEHLVAVSKDLRTTLYLPLQIREALSGVLIISSTGRTVQLSEESRKTCTTYANMAALAIANAQLYESSRRYVAALEQQYAFTQSVLDNAPMGMHMYQLEQDGRLVFTGANPAADRILQVANAQFVGKTIEEAFPPLAQTDVPARYRQVAREGGEWLSDQITYQDNAIQGAYQIKAFQTVPGKMAVFFEDVTQARQQELALRRSEERLRFALGAARQSWFDAYVQTGQIDVAPEYPRLLGFAPEEFQSSVQNWLDNIHPEDQARIAAMFQQILQHGGPCEAEYRRQTRAGNWKWMHSSGAVIERDAQGQPLRITGIHMDITERKQMELELARHKNELEALVVARTAALKASLQRLQDSSFAMDRVGIGIAWSDIETRRFIYVNDGVCRQLGYSRDELLGMTINDIAPDFSPEDTQQAMVAIRQAGGSMEFFTRHRRKDGSEFPVEVKAFIYHNGEREWLIAFHQDISQQKADEQALREAKQAAEAANVAKSAFLANMSHEIRTPMNAILGMAYLMRQENGLSVAQADRLDKLEVAGKHLLSLINDVLDLSKIEAGKIKLESLPFNPANLIDNVVSMMGASARIKGLAFRVERGELPEALYGDQMRILQCIFNLLGNAIKFTAQGGVTLRLRTAEMPGGQRVQLHIEVEDSGIGLSAEQLSRLFRPFEQADVSTTRHFGGSGLVLTKHLVELMGGETGARSVLGQGSVFWFTLPLAVCHEVPPAAPAVAGQGVVNWRGLVRQRVLVVEDDPVNQALLYELLQRLGLLVDLADNGAQAVQLVQQQPYALVLMDLQMPVLDGFEATRQMRAAGVTAPIVACTANAFVEDREACLAAGMVDFLPKPIQVETLQGLLVRYLLPSEAAATEQAAPLSAAPVADPLRALAVLQHLQPLLENGDFMAVQTLEAHFPLLQASLDAEQVALLLEQVENYDSENALLTLQVLLGSQAEGAGDE